MIAIARRYLILSCVCRHQHGQHRKHRQRIDLVEMFLIGWVVCRHHGGRAVCSEQHVSQARTDTPRLCTLLIIARLAHREQSIAVSMFLWSGDGRRCREDDNVQTSSTSCAECVSVFSFDSLLLLLLSSSSRSFTPKCVTR